MVEASFAVIKGLLISSKFLIGQQVITGILTEPYVRLTVYALNLKYRVDLLKNKLILRQCFLYYKSTFIRDIVSLHIFSEI